MAITVKERSEISQSLQRTYQRAHDAVQKQNFDYAFEMLRNVLLAEPGFEAARFTLRQAQLQRVGYSTSIARQITAFLKVAWPLYVSGPMALKKQEYAKALDIAEKAMEQDPTLVCTLQYLERAAHEAGLLNVAVNAMEVAFRFHPKNKRVLKRIADLYLERKEATKAIQMLQKLQTLQPNNLDIESQLKEATALAAMEEAHWEDAESYRDLIRDKDKAEVLEQKERVTSRDTESRSRLIEAALEDIEQQPTATKYKDLASLYAQDGQYDKAIEAYQKVNEVTGSFDPAIDSAITKVLQAKYNSEIADLKARIEQEPDRRDELQQEIEEKEQESDRQVLERLKKRVEQYPNETKFRYELAMVYLEHEEIDNALSEFQQAQRSPHLVQKSHLYMGKCLATKGLVDLAIEQYQAALSDVERLSKQERKEALYDLSLMHEQKGNSEEAIKVLKELYSLDVNYRDVSDRVQQYYQEQSEGEAQEENSGGDDAQGGER